MARRIRKATIPSGISFITIVCSVQNEFKICLCVRCFIHSKLYACERINELTLNLKPNSTIIDSFRLFVRTAYLLDDDFVV